MMIEKIQCLLGLHNWWLNTGVDAIWADEYHCLWEYCLNCDQYRIARKEPHFGKGYYIY